MNNSFFIHISPFIATKSCSFGVSIHVSKIHKGNQFDLNHLKMTEKVLSQGYLTKEARLGWPTWYACDNIDNGRIACLIEKCHFSADTLQGEL